MTPGSVFVLSCSCSTQQQKHLCVWWPPGLPGKQTLQGEIVVPVLGREIPCTYGWPLPCLLNYCSAGPWVAAVAPPHSSHFFFFGLSLIRIPLVRLSLGFDPKGLPELVFGLGRGSSHGGPLFWPVWRHTLLRCFATDPRWLCRVHGYLVDASKNKML